MGYRLAITYRDDVPSVAKLQERHVVLHRDDAHYGMAPDVCLTKSGKLLCVFRQSDAHVAHKYSRLVLLESTDRGIAWGNLRVLAETTSAEQGHWDTARICRLSDGRLVVIGNRMPTSESTWKSLGALAIYFWWSRDDGLTWSQPLMIDAVGDMPDKICELEGGDLLLTVQLEPTGDAPARKKVSCAVHRSHDHGRTWGELTIIAQDDVHDFCEPSLVLLPDGNLACYIRENSLKGLPTFVSFSEDKGRTWSTPVETEMNGHRPVAGVLQSGKVLVTYRNILGPTSTYAWVGDAYRKEAGETRDLDWEVTHQSPLGKILELDHDLSGCISDYGYGGWVQFPEGDIFCVYHQRGEDSPLKVRASNPYIHGCWFSEKDYAP